MIFAVRLWPLLVAFTVPGVYADSGDDYSNNLFTDLAPLLALFGDQFTKQFISQSMGWLDHVVFAMAPLGIITAIVGAIRVGGPLWLRAVIGRARENRAAVEVELMTSTSHEVCELWNGQGVVRSMGTPEVQQIIYLHSLKDNPDTLGLHTVETAMDEGLLGSWAFEDPLAKRFQKSPGGETGEEGTDEESGPPYSRNKKARQMPAPNLSLNLHGGTRARDLYLSAIVGILLQFGMLVFSGFAAYHPTKFPKNGTKSKPYAFPIMAAGTIVLMCGMLVCSAVIERSTEKKVFMAKIPPKNDATTGTARTEAASKLRARILWLQKSHIVSDQTFDSYVIFGRNKNAEETVDCILTSRRGESNEPSKGTITKGMAPTTTEVFTILGGFFGLVGFILQFQGLRGLNWSASIAQLVCIILMTVLRAWVRRGLIATPIARRVLDQHEMDWLALKIAPEFESAGGSKDCDFWPKSDEDSQTASECPSWRIYTNANNHAYDVTENSLPLKMHALNIRRRLGQLTNWIGKPSESSIALARSVGIVMDTLFGNDTENPDFEWRLRVQAEDGGNRNQGSHAQDQIIKFKVTKNAGKWKADATALEAAISLWAFYIRQLETRSEAQESKSGKNTDTDWLQQDLELRRQVRRILGPNTDDFKRYLGWWLDGGIGGAGEEEAGVTNLNPAQQFTGPIGFLGLESQRNDLNEQLDPGLIVNSQGKLELLLAQHIFTAFMWAIAKDADSTKRIASMLKGQTTIGYQDAFKIEVPDSLLSLKFHNKHLTEMANSIQRTGLGSIQDIHACLMPPFICTGEIPIEALVDFVRRKAKDYEVLGHWERVVPVYIKLFQICKTLGIEHATFRKATAILIDLFLTISTRLRLREPEDRDSADMKTLNNLRKDLLEELNPGELQQEPNPLPQGGSLQNLMCNFAKLYEEQQRLDRDLWDDLLPASDGYSSKVHQYFGHELNLDFKSIVTAEDAKARDTLGWSPLHYAVIRERDYHVEKQLKAGADPKAIDLAEWTPLHYAIMTRDHKDLEQIIWVLVEGGADIHMRGRDGIGLLHCAAKKGYTKVIEQLLQAGANIEIQDNSRKTPLHWAAGNECGDAAKLLLDKGAFIGARDSNGRTALHLAVTEETANALIAKGIEADVKDRGRRTALHSAACRGHEAVVRLLMDLYGTNKDLKNAKDRFGQTALHCAAAGGHEAIVKLLIDKYGFDKEAKRSDLGTALHGAAFWGHEAVVRLLLGLGADRDAGDHGGRMALHLATKQGQEAVVRLLIELGTNREARDNNGRTPMHFAIRWGQEAVFRLLVELGVDRNARDRSGSTALHLAARCGQEGVVRLLAELGVDWEAKDGDGWTALHCVASEGLEAAVQLLVELGADCDTRDGDGRTALQLAARWGHEEVVRLLVELGADCDAKDGDGRTALHFAARWGLEPVVRLLAELGADWEARDDDGRIALHLAVMQGHEAIARLFLRFGADPDARDIDGRTALHFGARWGYEAVVRLLVEFGADQEARDNDGRAALHFAARWGQEAVVRLLAKLGADREARDDDGRIALHLAVIRGHEAVARLLLKFGADPGAKDIDGRTALHFGARWGYEAVVRLLVEFGADQEAKDNDGRTALHFAARWGQEAVVRLLVGLGADREARGDDGRVALHLAAMQGHETVIRLLLQLGADLDAKDNDGGTALDVAGAAQREHGRIGGDHAAVVSALNSATATAIATRETDDRCI